ncbi:diguanylate cyclase [Phormidium sp. CLA17]|uniref:histidine kinase N-terminal 7TM domain-containing diguanylate cyclase n=1 Tax=Leptolyngbya sp. Cla-17 TaxID=2803751 RepID=UPI00149120E8|nr:histidine kinase N-terminal 7TM domain-containing protein [Leptolyngbya sp. Cla-17]MBM0744440.1 diguanylate cyclase [Leptolyngbya sp. Cla-17]
MLFKHNTSFAILSLTALLAVAVAAAAWRRRAASSASRPFILSLLSIAFYATVAALEAAAIALPDKIFWSKLEYVGSGCVVTFFLIFAIHFTHKRQWLTLKNTVLLWLLPSLNVVLVATNEQHRLVWSGFLPYSQGTNQIVYQHGPGFYWVMSCVYLYTLTGSLLLVKAMQQSARLQQQQSWLALAGALVPLLGGSAYMLNLTPAGLNLTPMSFLLTGIIYFVTLFRFRLFDLVPVARDTLIESMSDGVLVLDLHNRLIDINPAAQQLTGIRVTCLGQPLRQLFSSWQVIAQLCEASETVQCELLLKVSADCYVELHVIPLRDRCKGLTGRLLVLRNVTQRQQADLELRQANERLQAQLHEIKALQTQLREQAIRDALTGLFNRRYFEETLPRELARAAREAYPVAVILMDIDFFKQVNDTYGHQGGDCVLQAFGSLLRDHSQQGDIACRYGGEEFVLTLPAITLKDVYQRAEQIRRSFQAMRVQFGSATICTTLSLGVGLFPEHGDTSQSLMQVVDQALYIAKAAGRNCVRCVETVV